MTKTTIIVVSDTHGQTDVLLQMVKKHQHEGDYWIHLGDGEQDVRLIKKQFPFLKVFQVRGNCDVNSSLKEIETLFLCDKTIVFTHGHQQGVKHGLDRLKKIGQKNNADILLYGHTHESYIHYDENLCILNPGSLVFPRNGTASYGIITIDSRGIHPEIFEWM